MRQRSRFRLGGPATLADPKSLFRMKQIICRKEEDFCDKRGSETPSL